MFHHKAAALDVSERLQSPIEHERERRLRRIEVSKCTLDGNAAATEQIVGKIVFRLWPLSRFGPIS